MAKTKEHQVNNSMHAPSHPGRILKEEVIEPLDLTVGSAAEKLDVDRTTLSRLLNGRAAVSVEMAFRLSEALGTSPEVWLGLQQAYDVWSERQTKPTYLRNVESLMPQAQA